MSMPEIVKRTIQQAIKLLKSTEAATVKDSLTVQTERKWQGLTDEEIVAATNAVHGFGAIKQKDMNFAKAIEAKLKEKNQW